MINIRPASGRHSIKGALLAVEWPAPIERSVITEISRLHDQFKNDLPRKVLQNAVLLNIASAEQAAPMPQTVVPQVVGVVFDRLKPDGEAEWSLNIQRNMATVICNAYDRWQEVKARSLRYLALVLPLVLRYQPVSIVGLQYTDEFIASGDVNELTYDHVFRAGSRYVPANARDLRDLWHSHHGYFEARDEPSPHKRLTNINVSVTARGSERVMQILTAHKAILDQPTNDPNMLLAEGRLIDSTLEGMHDLNKEILRDLLNDAQRAQIGLS